MKNVKFKNISWIIFDCMETIIDMKVLPRKEDYAYWGYKKSKYKDYYRDFETFYKSFYEGKIKIEDTNEPYYEYELKELYKYAIQDNLPCAEDYFFDRVAKEMYDMFWEEYKSKCYIDDKKKTVINKLGSSYKLAILSNFKVYDGIEELLKKCEIYNSFQFITTSIKVGYRKPHRKIYEEAIKKTGVTANNILLIGDDYKNDYEGAKEAGLNVLFYDPYNKYTGIQERINNFEEIFSRFYVLKIQ